jgi:hypothetical protein
MLYISTLKSNHKSNHIHYSNSFDINNYNKIPYIHNGKLFETKNKLELCVASHY